MNKPCTSLPRPDSIIGGHSTFASIDKNRVPKPTTRFRPDLDPSLQNRQNSSSISFRRDGASLSLRWQQAFLAKTMHWRMTLHYRRKSHPSSPSSSLRSEKPSEKQRRWRCSDEDRGCDGAPPSVPAAKRKLRAKQHFHRPGYLYYFWHPGCRCFRRGALVLLMTSTPATNRQNEPIIAAFVIFPG